MIPAARLAVDGRDAFLTAEAVRQLTSRSERAKKGRCDQAGRSKGDLKKAGEVKAPHGRVESALIGSGLLPTPP